MPEESAYEIFQRLMNDLVHDAAKRHKKICDECWGIGYVNTNPAEPETACAFKCSHCNGTGWQHAE